MLLAIVGFLLLVCTQRVLEKVCGRLSWLCGTNFINISNVGLKCHGSNRWISVLGLH